MTSTTPSPVAAPPTALPLVVAVMGHASVAEPSTYNFGTGRLVAHAQQENPDARFHLFDRRMDDDEAEDLALLQQVQPQVVGLSCTLWSLARVVRLVGQLEQALPEARVVVGGPSVQDFEAVAGPTGPRPHHTVVGEGEVALSQILAALGAGDTPARGVWSAPPCADLDTLASPYLSEVLSPRGETVYLETSRGCPLRCAFCSAGGAEASQRWFSLDRVGAELRWALSRGLHEIDLCDAALNYDTPRLRQLVEAVEALDPHRRLAFTFALHADFLDAEQLQLLRRLRIRQVSIGLNSVNPATFAGVRRKIHPERFRDAVKGLARIARPVVTVILGLPGDTPHGFSDTLAYCETLDADIEVFELMVLPGTAYRLQAERFGLTFDPQRGNAVTGANGMSAADLDAMREIRSAFLSRRRDWRQAHFTGEQAHLTRGTAGALRDVLLRLGAIGPRAPLSLAGWAVGHLDAERHRGAVALTCVAADGETLMVLLSERDEGRRAFARSERFDLSYEVDSDGGPSRAATAWLRVFHARLCDADLQAIGQAQGRLTPQAAGK